MQLVNLTEQPIRIRLAFPADLTLPPSGRVARLATTTEPESVVFGRVGGDAVGVVEWRIPVAAGPIHHVVGLPEPTPGVAFLVTPDVLARCGGRTDVFAPGLAPEHRPVVERGRVVAVTCLAAAPVVMVEDDDTGTDEVAELGTAS